MTEKSYKCSSDTDIAASNEQHISQCQPCTVKNKQMAATFFCETCNEYQCQDCSQVHVLYSFMKSHVLVPIANARSRLSNADLKGFDRCMEHKKALKYFCKDENKMCCTTCAIDDHRKCTNVKSIAALPVEYINQECLTVKKKLVELKEKHASTISLVKSAVIDIEQQVQRFVKTLNAVRSKIIQRFDDFARDIMNESNTIRDQKVQQFNMLMTSFESAYKPLSSEMDFYDHVDKYGTPVKKFMVKHRLQESLNKYMSATGGPASCIKTTNLTLEFDDAVVFLAHSEKVLGLLKVSETEYRNDIQVLKNFIPVQSQNDNGSAIPQSPKRTQAHINSDEVTFIIRSLEKDEQENAVKRLETLLQRETFNKEFKDSIIKQLTDFEVREIEAIGKQHHVRIDVDTANGVIAASGITSNVMALSDKMHVLLKDISAAKKSKNASDLMSNMIEWFFIEVTQTGEILQPYDKVLSYKIEMAFKQQLPFLEFKTELGTKYILDFSKMLEHPADDPTDCVKVIRRDRMKDSSFELPKSWTAMNGNLRVVTLQATDPEYKDIAAKFTISSGCNTILKIERVQNKALWQQYQAKKKQLESQNPSTPNFTNEKLLWHGTASEAVDNINAHGFNRTYCGKNATALGEGVYFAVNASYFCGNIYSKPDQLNVKRMYHCRVLTGEYTRGRSGMRVPPNKPGAEIHALYDSVVDNVTAPSMYIIFHDTQAYPEYLISFSM